MWRLPSESVQNKNPYTTATWARVNENNENSWFLVEQIFINWIFCVSQDKHIRVQRENSEDALLFKIHSGAQWKFWDSSLKPSSGWQTNTNNLCFVVNRTLHLLSKGNESDASLTLYYMWLLIWINHWSCDYLFVYLNWYETLARIQLIAFFIQPSRFIRAFVLAKIFHALAIIVH